VSRRRRREAQRDGVQFVRGAIPEQRHDEGEPEARCRSTDGALGGQRLLSEAAVKQMTSKETGDLVETSYGFGLSVANPPGTGYGHGGAYSTDMWVNSNRQFITVFMVQHNGFPGNGGKSDGVFKEAALAAFGQ